MNVKEISTMIMEWFNHLSFLSWCEIIGTLLSLLGVWLTARQNIWCWPISIIAIVIYVYVFYKSGFYADSWLQVFFLATSIYGWYEWLYGGKEKTELEVTSPGLFPIVLTIIAGAIGTVVFAFILKKGTDSTVPWLDGGTTAFSLVAAWMVARKWIQNWLFWIVIDVVSVGMYSYKGLRVTGLQYCVLVVLAIIGYWEWKKQLQKA